MTLQTDVEVRVVTEADDLESLGRIVLESYLSLPGHPSESDYEEELADVGERVRTSTVFGAFEASTPLGCVTFVADASDPHAEDLLEHEASFRMLGVSPTAQGRGIGTALVQRCLSAAEKSGKTAVFIYSGDWMTTAHRMYDRLGFVRVPGRDWRIEHLGVTLLGLVRPIGRDDA